MSTVSPAASRELAEAVRAAGARMLDAPVSGSVVTLTEGELSVMVGGDRETFERVRSILEDIGPTVTHVGPNGQAALMKIATNLGRAFRCSRSGRPCCPPRRAASHANPPSGC